MSSTGARSSKPASTPRKSALSSSGAARTASADADVIDAAADPLSPAFNPSRLKVAELRSLLFQHDVHPPSSARKPALIEAYEEHVRGNANELRATRNRDLNVRPDDRGIVFLSNGKIQRSPSASVGPSTDGEGGDSSHDDSGYDRRARGRRSVSWAASVDSAEEADSAEPEADISSSVNVSTFSMENPFQSKPNSPSATTSSRKKAPRASEPAKKATSTSAKKRTPAARQSLPASRAKKDTLSDSDDGDEADTSAQSYADDSLASPLVQKQKRMRQWVDHAKDGREKEARNDDHADGGALSGLLSLVLLVAAAAWWIWYTRESKAIGFCDTSSHTNAIIDARAFDAQQRYRQARNDNVSDVLASLRIPDLVRPSCTPCPIHARCNSGELRGCESTDYVRRTPFMAHVPVARSFLPLSRIAPTCDPDEEKLLLAADLADEIEGRLRTWKADVYCNRQRARLGPRDEPDWGAEGVYALPLSDVYHDLKTAAERGNVLRSQSNDFFRALWHLAMTDLEASGRVQQRSARLLATRSAMGVGLTCRIRRATSSVWRLMRFWLAGLAVVVLTLQWLRWRVRGTSRLQQQAVELVDVALRALQTAKQRHASLGGSGGSGVEPYISITQLRDSVLRRHDGNMNEAARKTLWSRVSSLVEANTNVRTRQARVQGEWARVWEWVGPATLLEAAGQSSGRDMTEAQRTIKTSPAVKQDADGRWGSAAQPAQDYQRRHDYNAGQERETSASV